jgi:hypothetical protein
VSDDDDPMLSPELLAHYDVPAAPSDFPARMLALIAAAADPQLQPRRTRWWRGVAAAVAAVAIAIGAITIFRPEGAGDVAGSRIAQARETIAIGVRATAVAEAGTELSWTVHDGAAHVEQLRGSIFYRVEHGGAFDIHTPLGDVHVTGTCFSVRVIMKSPLSSDAIRGAVIGAGIATAVVVTVYEGGVSVANPVGQLRVGPGESAELRPGGAPRGTALAAAIADTRAAELAAARARVAELEHELDSSHGSDLPNGADPGRYYAPSAQTLRDMADKCWVAFDAPPFADDKDLDLVERDLADAVGVSDTDRATINANYRKLYDRDADEVRRLYMELTGADADAAAALSIAALIAEIDAKSPPDDEIAARRHFARERAGLDPAPTAAELAHRPAIERLLHVRASLGNDAESVAAGVVGAKRARDLRAHDGVGWRDSVSDYGGCDEHY